MFLWRWSKYYVGSWQTVLFKAEIKAFSVVFNKFSDVITFNVVFGWCFIRWTITTATRICLCSIELGQNRNEEPARKLHLQKHLLHFYGFELNPIHFPLLLFQILLNHCDYQWFKPNRNFVPCTSQQRLASSVMYVSINAHSFID